jgi:hypothetical protein
VSCIGFDALMMVNIKCAWPKSVPGLHTPVRVRCAHCSAHPKSGAAACLHSTPALCANSKKVYIPFLAVYMRIECMQEVRSKCLCQSSVQCANSSVLRRGEVLVETMR